MDVRLAAEAFLANKRIAVTGVSRRPEGHGVPGDRVHVGPSRLAAGGDAWQLDLVVADDHPDPASRRVTAIGEAKAGEAIGRRHLDRLTQARSRLGPRAKDARLLLIGSSFDPALDAEARRRGDVELVDLERLYRGD